MMSKVFRFKQFEVNQTGCAMKINTDGVLLAALAEAETPTRILDIGTGTGVMALMLAQRFPNAFVEAVEIDPSAAATAEQNFKNSPFADRIRSWNTAIEEFNSTEKFDLVITNPPYFVNDLRSMEEKKGIARHTNALFFELLIAKVISLLSAKGCFWFILPIKQADLLMELGMQKGLSINGLVLLHSDEQKAPFRKIVAMGRHADIQSVNHFYIYESDKVYTPAYRHLLKDFFLDY